MHAALLILEHTYGVWAQYRMGTGLLLLLLLPLLLLLLSLLLLLLLLILLLLLLLFFVVLLLLFRDHWPVHAMSRDCRFKL